MNTTIQLKYFKLYKEVDTVEKCRDRCKNKEKCVFFRYKVGVNTYFYERKKSVKKICSHTEVLEMGTGKDGFAYLWSWLTSSSLAGYLVGNSVRLEMQEDRVNHKYVQRHDIVNIYRLLF